MQQELRYSGHFSDGLTLRAEGEGDDVRIFGTAVPWDKLSVPLWRDYRSGKPVRERFVRGAFSEVLARPGVDVVAVREHDKARLLGRTSSGTLKVRETPVGLEYELMPPDTEDGRALVTLARRGDLRGSSFAFAVSEETGGVRYSDEGEIIVRTISRVEDLDDVSPVTRPAYTESALSARSADALQAELDALLYGGEEEMMRRYEAEGRLLELGL